MHTHTHTCACMHSHIHTCKHTPHSHSNMLLQHAHMHTHTPSLTHTHPHTHFSIAEDICCEVHKREKEQCVKEFISHLHVLSGTSFCDIFHSVTLCPLCTMQCQLIFNVINATRYEVTLLTTSNKKLKDQNHISHYGPKSEISGSR